MRQIFDSVKRTTWSTASGCSRVSARLPSLPFNVLDAVRKTLASEEAILLRTIPCFVFGFGFVCFFHDLTLEVGDVWGKPRPRGEEQSCSESRTDKTLRHCPLWSLSFQEVVSCAQNTRLVCSTPDDPPALKER